jgi:hypothetical protein
VHSSPQLITFISLISSLSTFPFFFTYPLLLQSVFDLIHHRSTPLGSIALQTKSISDQPRFSHYLAGNKENPQVLDNNAEKKYHKVDHFSADGNSE